MVDGNKDKLKNTKAGKGLQKGQERGWNFK